MPVSTDVDLPVRRRREHHPDGDAAASRRHLGEGAHPRQRLGKDAYGGPARQIVAAEDDTELTIFPTRDVQNGVGVTGGPAHAAAHLPPRQGAAPPVRPGRGAHREHRHFEQADDHLRRSRVRAYPGDARRVRYPHAADPGLRAVGLRVRRRRVPPARGNEHEMMPYRIVAARDGTRLDYDPAVPPGAPTTMNAGEVATFPPGRETRSSFARRTSSIRSTSPRT